MHEMSIARGIINHAGRIARQHGAGQVRRVRIAIGPLSGIDGRSLEFCFPYARTEDDLTKDCRLEITEVPLLLDCPRCHKQVEGSLTNLCCPLCGSHGATVSQGMDIQIKDLEVV